MDWSHQDLLSYVGRNSIHILGIYYAFVQVSQANVLTVTATGPDGTTKRHTGRVAALSSAVQMDHRDGCMIHDSLTHES